MTTTMPRDFVCAVCGTSSSHMEIMSTNSFGAPDLDTRPAEMQRSTIGSLVQRCPGCGYCADRIDKRRPGGRGVVDAQHYREQLECADRPELSNSFICAAMILETAGDLSGAAWHTIHAAWACDDEGEIDAAVSCRLLAIRRVSALHASGHRLSPQPGADAALLTDLTRRAGQFAQALELVDRALPVTEDDVIRAVLLFHKRLIASSDRGCHTVEEALRGGS